MEEIYKRIYEISQTGKKAAVCTVVETTGSTPRKAGAKMIVYDDARIEGTVGGGMLEKQVITDALDVIKNNDKSLKEYKLDAHLNMICGGRTLIFIESIESARRLIIFGAGHIASFLAGMAVGLGFSVSVVDDRPELLESEKFNNCRKISGIFADVHSKINIDNETMVCVMTRNHETDMEITAWCAKHNPLYLGMIAGKSKAAAAVRYFKEQGVDESIIARIDMPMGIKIRCETPAEIAVSVLARLIDVRLGAEPKNNA